MLDKIKALIRPLLNQVMQKAIGRLPVAVQPIARKLAERLGLAPKPRQLRAPRRQPTPALRTRHADAGCRGAARRNQPLDPAPGRSRLAGAAGGRGRRPEMQIEFDEQMAEAMLADESACELELEMARACVERRACRARCSRISIRRASASCNELEKLKEGENPAPYVENFLPAVLPAAAASRYAHRPATAS